MKKNDSVGDGGRKFIDKWVTENKSKYTMVDFCVLLESFAEDYNEFLLEELKKALRKTGG